MALGTRWGIAAAAALAMTPAARADDTKRENAATSAQSGGHLNEEQRQNKMPPQTSGIGRGDDTGGQPFGSGEERAADQQVAGEREKPSAENAAVHRGDAEKQAQRPSKHDNTDLVKKLWSSNVVEIEAAKVAKDQAQSERVKQFAELMEKDHGEMRDALADLAEKRNLKLEEDEALKGHKAHIEGMEELKGAQFDRHYMQMMVKHHAQAKKDVDAALKRAKTSGDTEFARVLQDAQTKISEHHRLAQNIEKNRGQQRMGRRAGEGPSGAGAAAEADAERAGARMERGAERTGETIESGAERTGEAIESGAERAGEAIESGAERTADAVERQTDRATGDR
jgi:putative membrane protein